MSIYDIIDVSKIGYTLFFGIAPVILLGVAILKPRGLYYMAIGTGFFGFASLICGELYLTVIYIIVFVGFIIFWMIKGGMNYQREGYTFDLYRELYESYYADDLNDDGINDAFDNWKIAHDPRFSWIFASRKVKRERKLRQEYSKFGSFVGYNPYFGDDIRKFAKGEAGSYTSNYTSEEAKAHAKADAEAAARRREREQQYYSSRNNTASRSEQKREEMDDAQRRVAAQHEFAKRNNLRYFAMCTSKDEGKKLYHKYAAKYHPDNAVTGDKEKFITIDEEYNRFMQIDDWDFVA